MLGIKKMRAIISAFLIGTTLKFVINLTLGDDGYFKKSENEEWICFAHLMFTECFI